MSNTPRVISPAIQDELVDEGIKDTVTEIIEFLSTAISNDEDCTGLYDGVFLNLVKLSDRCNSFLVLEAIYNEMHDLTSALIANNATPNEQFKVIDLISFLAEVAENILSAATCISDAIN